MKSPQSPAISFENSLSALAQVALRGTAAIGYALFLQTHEAPGLLRISGAGDPIAAEALLEKQSPETLLIFPLHTMGVLDGFLAFKFKDRATSARAERPLTHLAEAIETIWAARHRDALYRDLAARAATLEITLMDSRIADRAKGLLASLLAEGPRPGLIEALVGHVKNVLRPGSTLGTIETLVKDLEDELEERRVTSQAKAILQTAHSLPEEQAYTHLRTLSRQSRNRLKDVAQDVIANRAVAASAA